MNQSKLTAKELLRRYQQGERHFAEADLSGESLRGMKLQGIDLTGADLSHTDIRGTNFTDAKLVGAKLCGAKTGTLRRWILPKLLIAWMLMGLSGILSAVFWAYFAVQIFEPKGSNSLTNTVYGDIVGGIVGLGILIVFLILTYSRGILASTGVMITVVGVGVAGAIAFAFAGAFAGAGAGAFSIGIGIAGALSFAFSGSVGVAFAVAGAVAGAGAFAIAGAFAFSGGVGVAIAGAIAGAIVGAFSGAVDFGVAIAGAIAVAGIIITLILTYLISRRALKGDPRDLLICNVAVWFAGWRGTQFKGADLTDADCSGATLKSSHLYDATFTRTRFHLAEKVNLARLGKTILSDFAVQDLLITMRGRGKVYIGKNLKGANLEGADLADADFTEADLSQATLEGADLQRANLTKTQALSTRFRQADLTGACLEAWNIDSTTQLSGAVCEYVYLLNHQQERRPNSGSFQPGEFTKLFEEVLDTIDLIFQNGIDWKAFLQTFRQVQVQHEGAELAIQTIENKGDGVVVVKLHAAPDTNKEAVHQSFMNGYQTALKEAEERYKAQLHAKEEQIQDYRQQNADMQEVVKLLAARPINVDVKAIAQSKAMQGNDESQNFNVQGDFSIEAQNSVVNLRDISGQVSNQISQLPTDSTSSESNLKDLLAQLQQAIEEDSELGEAEKVDALTEVGELAKAAQNPKEGVMQKTAKGAMNALKGIAASLSDASKLAAACKELLPLVKAMFGLP